MISRLVRLPRTHVGLGRGVSPRTGASGPRHRLCARLDPRKCLLCSLSACSTLPRATEKRWEGLRRKACRSGNGLKRMALFSHGLNWYSNKKINLFPDSISLWWVCAWEVAHLFITLAFHNPPEGLRALHGSLSSHLFSTVFPPNKECRYYAQFTRSFETRAQDFRKHCVVAKGPTTTTKKTKKWRKNKHEGDHHHIDLT